MLTCGGSYPISTGDMGYSGKKIIIPRDGKLNADPALHLQASALISLRW